MNLIAFACHLPPAGDDTTTPAAIAERPARKNEHMQGRRANVLKKYAKLKAKREYRKAWRASQTPEQQKATAEYQKAWRASQTPEQRALRGAKARARAANVLPPGARAGFMARVKAMAAHDTGART